MRNSDINRTALMLLFGVLWVCSCQITAAKHDSRSDRIAGHLVARYIKTYLDSRQQSQELEAPIALFQDGTSKYWISMLTGLYSFDERTNSWKSLTDHNSNDVLPAVVTICESSDGKIWFRSIIDRDIRFYDGKRVQKVGDVSATNTLGPSLALFASHDGAVWVVSNSGLYLCNNDQVQQLTIPLDIERSYQALPQKSDSDIHAKLTEMHQRWSQRDVGRQSDQPLQTPRINSFTADILAGLEDQDENVWLSTQRAIIRFDKNKPEWKLYPLSPSQTRITRIFEDRSGRLWFADVNDHLSVYDKKKDSWVFYEVMGVQHQEPSKSPHPSANGNSVYQDATGQILFATTHGLIVFKESDNIWLQLTSENSALPDDNITTIMEDKTRRIWIGTTKGILILEQ